MKSDIHSGNRRSHDEQFETKTIKYQRQTTIGYINTQIIINMAFVNAVKYHFSDLPISVEETCSMRPRGPQNLAEVYRQKSAPRDQVEQLVPLPRVLVPCCCLHLPATMVQSPDIKYDFVNILIRFLIQIFTK